MSPFPALPSQQDVYRVATNQTWIDVANSKFLPDAFKLRKRDVDAASGVSVLVTDTCPNLEEAARLSHRDRVRAVCSINVGQVRGLEQGLDVVQDAPHHACINGLPFAEDESSLAEIKRVNDFAEILSDLSSVCRL